jgi:hypothetical protein
MRKFLLSAFQKQDVCMKDICTDTLPICACVSIYSSACLESITYALILTVTRWDPQKPRDVTNPHSQEPKLKLQDFGNISFLFTSIAEAKKQ